MRSQVIIITGTPGTGKTSLAKELASLTKYKHIDVNKLITERRLKTGYDSRRKVRIIDVAYLSNFLIKNYIKKPHKGLIIESHLAHNIPSTYAGLCLVTATDLKPLYKRLEKRGYSEEKIRENLDAEIFRVCENEAMELNHKLVIVDTTKKRPKMLAKELLPRIRHELRI